MSKVIVRTFCPTSVGVIIDGEQAQLFGGKDAPTRALAWAKKRSDHAEQETKVAMCEGGSIYHITNAGDDSEPEKLCGESLVRLVDDLGRHVILTAEEFDVLALDWLAQRLK